MVGLCGMDKYGGGTYTSEGIDAMCEALKGNRTLNSLSYASQRLEPSTAVQLAVELLAHVWCPSVAISLAGNHLGFIGGKSIAAALDQTQITYLRCVSHHA